MGWTRWLYRNKAVQILISIYMNDYYWNLSIRYKLQIKYNDLVLKLFCCLRYHIRMSFLQKSNKKPHKRESIKSFHIAYCLMAYSIITYYTICSFHAQDYDFLAFYIILVVPLLYTFNNRVGSSSNEDFILDITNYDESTSFETKLK